MASAPNLTEFFKYSKPDKPPCKLGFAIEQLKEHSKPGEAKQLEAALGTPNNIITAGAIVTWLEKREFPGVSSTAVVNHRKGRCTCAAN